MILLFSFDSHGAAQGEALSSTYHQCKNIYGNIFGNTISIEKKSRKIVNRWDQVVLIIHSLVIKYLWSYLVNKINNLKPQWTVHV